MAESARKPGPPRWVVRATAPFAMALSGRRWFPLFAILHHRGRRTGAHYAMPVALIPTESADIFLIGLPWGSKTNWAGNVLAAGGATLTWKGREHEARNPRRLDAMEAATLAKPFIRPVIARFPAAIVMTRH